MKETVLAPSSLAVALSGVVYEQPSRNASQVSNLGSSSASELWQCDTKPALQLTAS